MDLFNKLIRFRHIISVLGIYLFLSFAGCVMVVVRMLYTGKLGYIFLIWNLFLTWIPLGFSLIINYLYAFYRRSLMRTLLMMGAGAIWLAFYPNAPYIITDFIHLSQMKFYFSNHGYNMSFLVWYDFIMMSLFILTGFLLGFVSLYLIQRLLAERFNRFIGWVFVGSILFLSSFGIYLGRFIRWNSWDIISNPGALMQSILESFHLHAAAFTITFGLFLILIYFALYYLTRLNEYKVVFHYKV